MLDILLLNCYPFVFFLGYKGEYCGPLFFFFLRQKGGETLQLLLWILDIYMLIILDIEYFEKHFDM